MQLACSLSRVVVVVVVAAVSVPEPVWRHSLPSGKRNCESSSLLASLALLVSVCLCLSLSLSGVSEVRFSQCCITVPSQVDC